MYRKQQYSIETPENLKNLFGGQLDEENRWIEMSKMIPWEEYEEEGRVLNLWKRVIINKCKS
ncbi:MAG: hypothetical protein KA717_06860 [Woronichinia naegeliana WA131]|jgi:hypothetical protein|uniref:Uncharacterized protein n=1 Tax=Woronichinia naegeliana WA131 TaxID=2824559 RepID=A0A977KZ27_9CYAN|nr:MAG: hypothetical protein KA717_06860 [Woronichinia naegeliana WA131]